MKRLIVSAVCSSMLLLTAISASAAHNNDAVCSNLKSMINKQKMTYSHYEKVYNKSNTNITTAKHDVAMHEKNVAMAKARIKALKKQLKQQHHQLVNSQKMVQTAKQKVAGASSGLSAVNSRVLSNERQLLNSLNKQYQDMCVPHKNIVGPKPAHHLDKHVVPPKKPSSSQASSSASRDSSLEKRFYP